MWKTVTFNNSMKLTIIFLACYFFTEIDSLRHFRRGRRRGGTLGEPEDVDLSKQNPTAVTELMITQRLDHFNPIDKRTWQQRYFVNDRFYNSTKGGPAFLFVSGENAAAISWMSVGAWTDHAAKHGALLFQLEHRFYGKSRPTEDLSTENLRYLTSEQALADLANFISSMNENFTLPSDVKWITYGGSYGGSLAAWMRLKYPHLVHGSVSSSGPLLALLDFKEYYTKAAESLASHSDDCVAAIEHGMLQVGTLLKQVIGQSNLNDIFNLCDPLEKFIENSNYLSSFYEILANNFAEAVQYNKGSTTGRYRAANITINLVCSIMVDEDLGPPIYRLGAVNARLLKAYDEQCLDYNYEKNLADMRNVSWDGDAAGGWRQWFYQTCTEFGFYQTSSDVPHIFGDRFPIEYYVQECADIYGPIYDREFMDAIVNQTNSQYGGKNIKVSNVVFVQGSVDPWHVLGLTETVHSDAPAIFIQGTSHGLDLFPKAPTDPPELTAARVEIAKIVDSWLEQN